MRIIKYLVKSINLLNIALLVTIVTVVLVALVPLFHIRVNYVPPAVKPKLMLEKEAPDENGQAPSPADYMIIGENNLFHPERRVPPEKKDAKPLPRPELVLFGTVITDNLSIAYIEDKKSPKTSGGRGKRQSVVKKGDVLGGFVLKEIRTDRIVLARGGESMIVPLAEAGKRSGSEKSYTPNLLAPSTGPALPAPQPASLPTPNRNASASVPRAIEAHNVFVPSPSLSRRSIARYQMMQGLQ